MPETGVTNAQWDQIRCRAHETVPGCPRPKTPAPPPSPPLTSDTVKLPATSKSWICRDPELAKKLQPTGYQAFEREMQWFKSDVPVEPERREARLREFSRRLTLAFDAPDSCKKGFRYSEADLRAVASLAFQKMGFTTGVDHELYQRGNIIASAAAFKRHQGQ